MTDPEIQSLAKKHPRLTSWIRRRFVRGQFSGLPLTILAIVLMYVLALLAGIIEDVIRSEVILAADTRMANLFYSFRSLPVLKFFFVITVLGKVPVVVVLALLFSLFLWLAFKRFAPFLIFWLVIVSSESFTFVGKILLHRARPVTAAYAETAASFPSAHATISVALFGFIAYIIWRVSKTKKVRAAVAFLSLAIIFLIGLSRLYLGVHWFSDVWAGYLIGCLWLVVGISLLEWRWYGQAIERLSPRVRAWGIGLLIVGVIFYGGASVYLVSRWQPITPAFDNPAVVSQVFDVFTVYQRSRYTETLIGTRQEPLSFIIMAPDDAAVVAAFADAGWQLADGVNFSSVTRMARAALFNQPYATAPMTPDFWNGQVHDFGWEKTTEQASVRQRHHTRFWRTNFQTTDGQNIYFGTASLDIGIKWLVTHQISPDIDTEREFIFNDLELAGALADTQKEKLVDPVLGQNFSGDLFFTDGQVYIVRLR